MKLSLRNYRDENDNQRIRHFLRQVFLLNGRRQFSWTVVRWDYWRWHGIQNLGHGTLDRDVYLWETLDGQLAAVLNREEPGHAFLQVHPSFKTVDLEEQMIAQAESCLRVTRNQGAGVLWLWTDAGDAQRIQILKKRGFVHKAEWYEQQWRRSLDLPIPECPLREGYIIRPLGDASELPSRSWASWRAFHSQEPDERYQADWSWYLNIQAAPLYRQDLDLVAIAPTGEVAAFTTCWYDELTQSGEFEPVGTMPEHQRRGLASALLTEAMQRLKKLGATQCMTAGGSPWANGLYRSVLGPVYDLYQPWEKRWP